uniref:Uncharacterized protein n=1 Tax=Glossina pallidipes TaxID=7398 RepID=A0A1A9ZH10_GLOPL
MQSADRKCCIHSVKSGGIIPRLNKVVLDDKNVRRCFRAKPSKLVDDKSKVGGEGGGGHAPIDGGGRAAAMPGNGPREL